MSRVTGGEGWFSVSGKIGGSHQSVGSRSTDFNHRYLLDNIFLNAAKLYFPPFVTLLPHEMSDNTPYLKFQVFKHYTISDGNELLKLFAWKSFNLSKTAPGKPFPLFKQQNWTSAILALSLGMTVETPLLSIGLVAWGKIPSAGLIHQWEPADWCPTTVLAQFAAHLSLELIQELHPLTMLRQKPLNLKVRCEWNSKWTEINILFQGNFQVPFCFLPTWNAAPFTNFLFAFLPACLPIITNYRTNNGGNTVMNSNLLVFFSFVCRCTWFKYLR